MNIKLLIVFLGEYGEGLLVLTIPIILVISLLIFVYNNEPNPECNTNADNSHITIHTVDNHEYLVYHYDRSGGICHKVDCKFCMAKSNTTDTAK
jgi:hypothetical protein